MAIGLAAQTIVKDCLNGMLILLEEQYNVGDVVKVAGVSGKVEGMTLRRTMVRDNDGTLYIIPNSQITTVANLMRDFSVATINVSVDFSADPDKVMALLKEVAMGVRNDPAYKDVFLADPTLLGSGRDQGIAGYLSGAVEDDAQSAVGGDARDAAADPDCACEAPFSAGRSAAGVRTWRKSTPQELSEAADPTAAKPNEVNPFTGEGM